MEEEKQEKTGDVNILDLVPCFGLCCCIFSMYTVIPDCCGSVCENIICCLGCKVMTCKSSKEEGVMCKLIGADIDCVPFKVCCQGRSQVCCLDSRVSLPPTKEIPCLVTCCFLTCMYDYTCLCTCGSDVEGMHIKINRKIAMEGYEVDTDDDDNRQKRKDKGKRKQKNSNNEWDEVQDAETGKTYYVNRETQETQWERPY